MDRVSTDAAVSDEAPFSRVALLGFGFMAASLARRIKTTFPKVVIHGQARKFDTRQQAMALGLADFIFERPAEAVADCDLVIACTPVSIIPQVVSDAMGGLKPGAVVTDVGSTKAWLEERLRDPVSQVDGIFVGGHPMCGSEQTGLDAADPSIYEGAVVVLTGEEDAETDAGKRLAAFWEQLGSRPMWMSAQAHDDVVGRTSHLPHLLATVLATTVAREGVEGGVGTLCGTGFAGTSRLAEGSPDMWRDIIRTNRDAVVREMRAYIQGMTAFTDQIAADDLDGVMETLEKGRDDRRTMVEYRKSI